MHKAINSKSTIVHYNLDWQKKINDNDRLSAQNKVYLAFDKLYSHILKRPIRGNILDIGSGDGSLVTVLNRQKGIKAQGVDISHGVNFETDALPFKTGEFDIAIMHSVLEHLYDPGNLLVEIHRILKNKGSLIIVTPNFDLSHLTYCDRDFYDDPTHVHPYFSVSLKHLMRIHNYRLLFMGAWTAGKSVLFWKLPMKLQFYLGGLLPFSGTNRWAPAPLKGKTRAILAVFESECSEPSQTPRRISTRSRLHGTVTKR